MSDEIPDLFNFCIKAAFCCVISLLYSIRVEGLVATIDILFAPIIALTNNLGALIHGTQTVFTTGVSRSLDAFGVFQPVVIFVIVLYCSRMALITLDTLSDAASTVETSIEVADQEDNERDDPDETDDNHQDVDDPVDRLHEQYAAGEITELELEQRLERELLEAADWYEPNKSDIDDDLDAELEREREPDRVRAPVKKPDIGGIKRNESENDE